MTVIVALLCVDDCVVAALLCVDHCVVAALLCFTGGLLHELSNDGARHRFAEYLDELLLPLMVKSTNVSAVYFYILCIDCLLVVLFSALDQTHCLLFTSCSIGSFFLLLLFLLFIFLPSPGFLLLSLLFTHISQLHFCCWSRHNCGHL